MRDYHLAYLEERLEEWADWFSRDYHGLGYPTQTMEYRLIRGIITKSASVSYHPGYVPSHPQAEEMEALVSEMDRYNTHMATALRCYYFKSGGLIAKAKILRISHMHFKNYVNMARQWLLGRLSAQESYQKSYSKKSFKKSGKMAKSPCQLK